MVLRWKKAERKYKVEEKFHRCFLDYLLKNGMLHTAATLQKEAEYSEVGIKRNVATVPNKMEEEMDLQGRKAEAMVTDEESGLKLMFHRCLLEYLVKKKMFQTAVAFRKEAKYRVGPFDVKDPAGFLLFGFTYACVLKLEKAGASGRSTSASIKEKSIKRIEIIPAGTQDLHSKVPKPPASVKGGQSPGLVEQTQWKSKHVNWSNISLDWSRYQVTKPSPGPKDRGFCFKEVKSSGGIILTCDFSSDGNWLAWAEEGGRVGRMKVPMLGYTAYNHAELGACGDYVTDLRFSPTTGMFATSSSDGKIMIWDPANRHGPVWEDFGHEHRVESLDYHPTQNLICSCDSEGFVMFWDAGIMLPVDSFEGATKRVRFQPREGRLLAFSNMNEVLLRDLSTGNDLLESVQHHDEITCICWDRTGRYFATVSSDVARIWSCGGELMYKLFAVDDDFRTCAFHPDHELLLVIGSDTYLILWNPSVTNVIRKVRAHDDIISAMTSSCQNGKIASGSNEIKIWELRWI